MGGEECYTKDKIVIIALCIRWWDIFLLFLLISYLLFLLILRGRLVSFARKLWKINWRGIQANVENSVQILKSKGTRAQNNKTVTSFIVVNFEKVKVFLLLNCGTCSTFHFRFNLTKTRSRICYLIRGHPLFEPKLDLSRMVKEITKCPRVYRRAAYVRHISAEATHFQVVGSEQGWESQEFSAWAEDACISSCLNFQRSQSAVTVEQPRWVDRLVRLLRDCCTSDKARGQTV